MMGFRFLKKEGVSKLPKAPGVYAFSTTDGKAREFLYIGKAANLKDRVKTHFYPVKYREAVILPKAKLFNRVKQIGYIPTNSEIAALILEAQLIRKHQPKYNVVWKDNKNFFFVGITNEDFPRIFWTHQTKVKSPRATKGRGRRQSKVKISYIGPFVDGKALKQTLKVLRKAFPYRSCNPPAGGLPKKPCLWYQLGRCPAPCLLKSNLGKQIPKAREKMQSECKANAKNIIKILQGKKVVVLKNLKKEMRMASRLQDFERAASLRDQVEALEKIFLHSRVLQWTETAYVLPRRSPDYYVWKDTEEKLRKILKTERKIERIEGYDVSNIQGKEATGSMVSFKKGRPDKALYRHFKIKVEGKPNDVAMLQEVLKRRLSHPEWEFPDLILIDGGIAQLNAALKVKVQNARLRQGSHLRKSFGGQVGGQAPYKSMDYTGQAKLKTIKIIALAKRKNKLFIEGKKNSILLKGLPREISNLILQVRDEAHRFAISYHRKLRKRVFFG